MCREKMTIFLRAVLASFSESELSINSLTPQIIRGFDRPVKAPSQASSFLWISIKGYAYLIGNDRKAGIVLLDRDDGLGWMQDSERKRWRRPFNWPPSARQFTPGLQRTADFLTWLIFLLMLATIGCALFIWPVLLFLTVHTVTSGSPDDIRNTFLAIAALIGVRFLIWRTLISAKQTDINREAHYTALFTKAVEQLGADKVVKRREFRPEYQSFRQNIRSVVKSSGCKQCLQTTQS
jgi:hypothetical protein